MPAVPQHTCVKPEFPGAFADSRRFDRFNKEYKAYSECIKKYVDDTKVLADAMVEAGNKAIKEFNTFNEELAERQAAKKARNFKLADEIRQKLSDSGILLEDSKDGSVRWKYK